ncbi:HNH endonuclease signature motif containing protein [Oceanobacillus oncorhynchi]|uniref:HNH endonuclease n=1 Tax=Oceanobacillus oncorhynchi TaxID=545501 RepID=UPI00299F8715|nr:HNH endonuclease signature motif containing protein [Oceanobacillus oncorhynchi]
MFLRRNPLCVHCEREGKLTPANEVDHIVPHKGNQKLFWDINNWQGLCKTCHSIKTNKEMKIQ